MELNYNSNHIHISDKPKYSDNCIIVDNGFNGFVRNFPLNYNIHIKGMKGLVTPNTVGIWKIKYLKKSKIRYV